MFAEVFLAAIPQPDAQHLRDPLFLLLAEALVEDEGALALEAAGSVAMGLPMGAGEPDASGRLLDQLGPAQFVVGFSIRGHEGGR